MKDIIHKQRLEITTISQTLTRKETELKEYTNSSQKIDDNTLKLKLLRAKLRERDIEIIELIKDSNRKKEALDQIKSLLHETQFRDKVKQLDLGILEEHLQVIQSGQTDIENQQRQELYKLREKHNVNVHGIEELRVLYRKLDDLNYKLEAFTKTQNN